MIAAHLEPKGLNPDTPSLNDNYHDDRIHDALICSKRLRNAILRAKGLPLPEEPLIAYSPPPRRPVGHRPRVALPDPKPSACCDKCGAPVAPKGALVADIVAAVTTYYRLPENALISDQRGWAIAHPRQIAMFLASELTRKSLPDIGRRFNRDHTTVMYAIRITRHRIATDRNVEHDVSVIRRMLGK